jgi:hypothetical protein
MVIVLEKGLIEQTHDEIINNIVNSWGLESRIFPFVKQNCFISVKVNHLPKIINNPMLIEKINGWVEDLNVKEKDEFIQEVLISPRVILQKNGEWNATINIKCLNDLVDSILTKHDFSYMKTTKATKLFYSMYILETNSLLHYYEIHNIGHKTIITPDIYTQAAVMAMQMFLTKLGDAEVSFAFDYFFNKFSYSFNFLSGKLYGKRMVLISKLLQVYGAYSNSPVSLPLIVVQ